MTAKRVALFLVPLAFMVIATVVTSGGEHWLSSLGKSEAGKLMLGRAAIALPYALAAAVGVVFLFAAAGSTKIKTAGWGVAAGGAATIAIAAMREIARLQGLVEKLPPK